MIYYIVKLDIDPSIYQQFEEWLPEHINEVLEIEGFVCAQILEEVQNELSKHRLVVKYQVASLEKLNIYLNEHAATLRNKTFVKFGDKFIAAREILHVKTTINSKNI